jgi:benzoyl-CoA reductase subunit B
MMDAIAKNWKCDGIILHYNRGCEGLSMGIAENRLGLIERGNRVMIYEGNMGDEREFDEAATLNRIDIFMDSIGLKKPK